MSEPQAAIRARRLSKAFGGQAVLKALDLDIVSGQSVALTGANGAGKTTLLRCLASLVRPDEGEVRWFGQLAGREAATRRWIGLVGHETGLYAHLTLRENLAFAARMSGTDHPRRRSEQWLDATGLLPYAETLPARLSRGMRQRLAIARALIHDPPLLLFDEPFVHLDTPGTEWLMTLLTELRRRGRTLCFVTHQPKIVRRMATRVLELRAGKVCDVDCRFSPRESSDPVDCRLSLRESIATADCRLSLRESSAPVDCRLSLRESSAPVDCRLSLRESSATFAERKATDRAA
jgi:heme ABC exporter ATP-binding subunit CcmA